VRSSDLTIKRGIPLLRVKYPFLRFIGHSPPMIPRHKPSSPSALLAR
jgi:hypothetical protein